MSTGCTLSAQLLWQDKLLNPGALASRNLRDHRLQEGHSCERFAALYSHVPRVRTPGILWEATARRVLTMEWIDGVKLTDKAKMDAAGLDIIDFVNVRPWSVLCLAKRRLFAC
jgi:ABC1 atypical kinase-like domain